MKDKKFLLWTSLLTLLPIGLGLLLWNILPAELPTHWGAGGAVNGWSGKPFTVFGIPAIMLAAHWICIGGVWLDRRNVNHNRKIMKVILMVFPVLSNVMMIMLYNAALGLELNMTGVLGPLLGILFICTGNYLPKCRQNATLGIKLKWTLYSEENWNKTHRFGGKVFVLGGLIFLALGLLPQKWMVGTMLANIALIALAPTVYSYLLYKKQVKNGTWTQSAASREMAKASPLITRLSMVLIAVVLCVVLVVCFTGDIEVICYDEYLKINASYWNDHTLFYDVIDSVEYREEGVDGIREWGFGSLRLLAGTFSNEEFGYYTRYTYTGTGPCVVVHHRDEVLVLGGETEAETLELYEAILDAVG